MLKKYLTLNFGMSPKMKVGERNTRNKNQSKALTKKKNTWKKVC